MKAALLALVLCATALAGKTVTVGSKSFTESVVLAEILTGLVRDAGGSAVHRAELGGTQVLWKALQRGDIDAYVEYTGTIAQELLPEKKSRTENELRAELEKLGIGMTASLGFDDTYAIGMKRALAEKMGVRAISDLRRFPDLKLGLSHEFLDRAEGWPNVKKRYELPQTNVRGLQHDVAYYAIETNEIQATDLYSTDAEIAYYDLAVLADDRHVFPEYRAVVLYRRELDPAAIAAFRKLEGKIPAAKMIAMNAAAKIRKQPESRVAGDFLGETFAASASRAASVSVGERLRHSTWQHLYLVLVSLAATILVALPLGVLAARRPALGEVILAVAGILQTIPSLALLVFMIPLLGIGSKPAIVALFLYGLLPIIRNTYTGLRDIPPSLLESAEALGLPPLAKLWRVELPLASRAILAGIKTSAVITVGTATLGAIIGAGGYGEPILIGIRRDDIPMILQGAVPAAVMALAVQGLFAIVERVVIPRGLRV